MATSIWKLRCIILLFVVCSALYIAVGPVAYTWNRKEIRDNTRERQVTGTKNLQKTLGKHGVNILEHVEKVPEVLKVSDREVSDIKRPPHASSRINLPGRLKAVQPETVIEQDDHLINDHDTDSPVYDCSDDIGGSFESKLSVYGKPVYSKNKTVMYISMPKSGSRTFVWTSMKLREVHHFGSTVNIDYMLEDNLPLKMRDRMDAKLQDAEAGAILHGHYRYIDMYGSPKKPIMMSMIRDPVERFGSHFYFMRNGDMDMSKEELIKKLGPRMALPNETLDDCIEKDRQDCTNTLYRNLYVTSFCGYEERCSNDPAFALEQAKLNVEKFLVIGLMEEYDLSMAVFEKLLPQTFGGAVRIYEESKGDSMERTKTSFKKPPSQKTYSILKQRMKYDYAFYDYIKKRLHKVARRLDIGHCAPSS